ncbi:MAG: NAD(P)H oxidoreductase [Proteobacteria bacterium]|nr:NAD(P)H oxidoreductase [Pseudomonadota bacterium]
MRALLVVDHPRADSLTHAVAREFAKSATAQGVEIEWADLAREGFDPVMTAADEPDWADPRKRYSEAVRTEMARLERNEASVLVFPVWWWSLPARLKGWIDRVWNHGFAYGDRHLPQRRVWLIGVAGAGESAYAARGYAEAMRTQLEVGVLEYCGVAERRFELLYGTIESADAAATAVARAQALGREFAL